MSQHPYPLYRMEEVVKKTLIYYKMNKGALAAMVSIVVVVIAIGLYFGTKKKDNGGGVGPGGAGPGGAGTDKRRDEKTPPNEFAGGSMIHLDRHHVKCGDDGLSSIKLAMDGDSNMLYKYKCLDGIDSPSGPLKDTGANDWGGNNAIYLDRHTLDCGKAAINEFKLVRPTPSQISYNYKCSSKDSTGACRDVDVKSTVKGKAGSTGSMVDTNVACAKDEVLTNFKFYRVEHDTPNETAGYKYKCCKK